MEASGCDCYRLLKGLACRVHYVPPVSIQDQADGSGKRRLDSGEVGRWKLTDDPPPKKKAQPSSTLEDGGRTDGGHKRKKEKEQPQDSGPKKKVSGMPCVCLFSDGVSCDPLHCLLKSFHRLSLLE